MKTLKDCTFEPRRRGICARAIATGRQSPEDPLSTWAVAPADEDDINHTRQTHWPAPIPAPKQRRGPLFWPDTTLSTGPIDGVADSRKDNYALAENSPYAVSTPWVFLASPPMLATCVHYHAQWVIPDGYGEV